MSEFESFSRIEQKIFLVLFYNDNKKLTGTAIDDKINANYAMGVGSKECNPSYLLCKLRELHRHGWLEKESIRRQGQFSFYWLSQKALPMIQLWKSPLESESIEPKEQDNENK